MSISPIERFNEWISNFNVVLHKPSDEIFNIWYENDKFIDEINSKNLTFTLGHNIFSAFDSDEFAKHLKFHHPHNLRKTKLFEINDVVDVAESINWVEKGKVSSVKDQGSCGSCYSFSAIGNLESVNKKSD